MIAWILLGAMSLGGADFGADEMGQGSPPDANQLAPLPLDSDGDGVPDAVETNPNRALPMTLDLQSALHIFHQRGFDLLLADMAVDNAAGAVQGAGAVNNPQLGGSLGQSFNVPSKFCIGCAGTAVGANFTDSAALFDIITGKRGLRVDVARAALTAAKQNRADAQRTLEFLVKSQYLAVAVDKTTLAFAEQVQATYHRTAVLFTTRYEAGAVSEADLARIETEGMGAEQNVDNAKQQLQLDKIALAFLLGVRGVAPPYDVHDTWLERAGHTVADTMTLQEMVDTAKAHRPDLMAQTAQKERASAAIDYAHRLRVPDIALSLSYSAEGTQTSAVQPPTLSFGLSLTLPLFYQFQGEERQAIADLNSQTLLYHKLEAQVASDVSTAQVSLITATSKVQRMRTRLRVRAGRALELVELQYRKGATSLLDLLDAQRTFIATNQDYIANMSDYWTAIFQLEEAVATEFKAQ